MIHTSPTAAGRAIITLLAEPIGGDGARKRAFKNEAMRLLKALATCLDLQKGSFDLRWNEGGPAVSGEATLHAEAVYVQVSQSCVAPVLYRSCSGRRDYRGGPNRWAGAEMLADPVRLADRIAGDLDLARKPSDRLI